MQAKREWHDILRVVKEKNLQLGLFPVRLSFRVEREIKHFSNKEKLKEFINIKPILKVVLNSFPHVEKKGVQQDVRIYQFSSV